MDNTARIKKVNMEIARIRDLNMENRVELKILWTFSSDSHGNLLGSHKTLPTPDVAVLILRQKLLVIGHGPRTPSIFSCARALFYQELMNVFSH